MKRYQVFEHREGKMEFLGSCPAASPQAAVDTVRRYAMRAESIPMTARPVTITKR